jgi:hypothetical protein
MTEEDLKLMEKYGVTFEKKVVFKFFYKDYKTTNTTSSVTH